MKHPGLSLFAVESLATSRSKSCISCRERKRKCSRESPKCSQCQKSSIPCFYSEKSRGYRDFKLHEQAKILLGLSSQAHCFPSVPKNTHRVPEDTTPEQGYRSGQIVVTDDILESHDTEPDILSRKRSITSVSSASNGVKKPSHSPSRDSSSVLSGLFEDLESLNTAETDVNRPDMTKWNNIGAVLPEQANILTTMPAAKSMWPNIHKDQLHRFKNDPNVRVGPIYTKIFTSSLYCTGKSLDIDLNLLESYLPLRKVCDTLFARYVNSVHPIMPLLDIKKLHPQYEMFWNNKMSVSISFYIILSALLYAGSVSEFEQLTISQTSTYTKQECIDLMRHLVGMAEIALAVSDFPTKVTVVGLQASVILHSAVRNDCRTDDCGSVANLVRLTQLINLNRDPQSYHKIEDALLVQERRLLWWHVYYLDSTTALSSRLAPVIVEDEYDTCFPIEYKENSGLYKLDLSIAFANGRFRWAETCNKITRRGFLLKPVTRTEADRLILEIDNLGFHCTLSILRILDQPNVMPNQEHFASFSSSMLATFRDRCLCLLNMILSTRQDLIQTSSTADILDNSVGDSLVKHTLHLLLEFCKHGSMPHNAIFLWEIRKYQPIQVLLFLLRNLIADAKKLLFNTETLRNDERVLAIENSLNVLGYLSDHSTKLCQERWNMVRELKATTWEQLFGSTNDLSSSDTSSPKTSPGESKVAEAFGEDWDAIIKKLTAVENTIDENIFATDWDETSGRYVM
ncbi:CIC11C00000002791 [Sungouiella intermedia]|uniref:CIC11C00000002791 n=1 Tax=Sungouiella intermedia TaxID=45354 RepID=A0A1L0DKS6_9ASCO|nr:CIC11C00000002791 [[Candida] intermedia]